MKAARTPHVIASTELKDFMIAGKAILTFQSSKSLRHFTYLVEKDKAKEIWYVKVLTSPDNLKGYTYLGILYFEGNTAAYKHGKKSKVTTDAETVKVFLWVLNKLKTASYDVLDKMIIRHEGYCCRCGRVLTRPDSIDFGIGPECMKLSKK